MIAWREIQRQNFTSWEKLAAFLQLATNGPVIKSRFSLNLPLRLAQKIKKRDWDDPILKQFLPHRLEMVKNPEFTDDPVGDQHSQQSEKLLKKYQGRALLICTSSCAMHCRYCFRQNFPYETQGGFDDELRLIEQDASLTEIILSGGDPLSLADRVLEELLHRLDQISHLKRVRFHTRFPIGIPERIDTPFLEILANRRLQVIFVIHCNHPQELDDDVAKALKKIQCLGIPVLNQAVLLQGVNDSVEVLKELCEKLADAGVLPYYLHQLDKVQGAAHFEVDEQKGQALIDELTTLLSGYAVPKYVKEVSGHPSKLHLIECLQS